MSKNSRIFLNDNLLSVNHRGMKRYFKAIVDATIAELGHNSIICSPESRNYGTATYIPSIQFNGNQPLRLNQFIVSATVLWKKPALLFNAFYNHVRIPIPQVFTLYDMIPELFPCYFDPHHPGNRKFMAEKKRCFEQAVLIFAISASAAQDALAYYPNLNPNKIKITHLGVSNFFFETTQCLLSQNSKPYFLYVGHRMGHKNFKNLLIAFAHSGLAAEFDLRVISPYDFTPEEKLIIQDYQIRDSVKINPSATDTVLRNNYANAVAFVYPSVYEGFGLPILEAMASGTLVATSLTSSMAEIGGDTAFYFDPKNTESIANCLIRITRLTSQERQDKVAQGKTRASTFTWTNCQQQTLEALQQLI